MQIDDAFGFNELIGLALDYHSYNPAGLVGQTLPTVAAERFGSLGDVLTVDQPAAPQMLVNIFGSSLVTPTTPRRTRRATPAPAARHADARGGGQFEHGRATTHTPATTAPPSFDPVPCSPA